MTRFLRHKRKGTIYGWSPNLAIVPDLEEVTEKEAFPERFAPESVKIRKGKSKVNLETEPELLADLEPPVGNAEINAEASAGLE